MGFSVMLYISNLLVRESFIHLSYAIISVETLQKEALVCWKEFKTQIDF